MPSESEKDRQELSDREKAAKTLARLRQLRQMEKQGRAMRRLARKMQKKNEGRVRKPKVKNRQRERVVVVSVKGVPQENPNG